MYLLKCSWVAELVSIVVQLLMCEGLTGKKNNILEMDTKSIRFVQRKEEFAIIVGMN